MDVRAATEALARSRATWAHDPFGFDAAHAIRAALIELAEALEAEHRDEEAIPVWKEAEDVQWGIGTFASGSGEGLASMHEVYVLMLRRARAEERIADAGGGDSAERRARAAALRARIASDPNGIGESVLAGENSLLPR